MASKPHFKRHSDLFWRNFMKEMFMSRSIKYYGWKCLSDSLAVKLFPEIQTRIFGGMETARWISKMRTIQPKKSNGTEIPDNKFLNIWVYLERFPFDLKFRFEFPRNFQWRMEQHYPEFPEKRTTSRGIPRFLGRKQDDESRYLRCW